MSLIAMTFLFTSCGSDDSGDTAQEVTSITLSSNVNGALVGEQVVFTVKDNNNNVVTANAVIKANGTTISSSHAFTATGTYNVVATYSGKTSNTLSITIDEESSISLTYSPEEVISTDMVTFTVKNNLNNDVTANTTFTLDGVAITNPYQFTELGANEVTATYNSFTTTATVNVGRGFTKKILLEDFTGTWCQYCPGASAAVANVMNSNSKVFSVGYHVSYSASQGIDPMQIPETVFFTGQYGVSAFPTVFYAGPANAEWNFPGISQLNTELAKKATTGLALNAEIVSGMLNIEVKVGFNEIPNEEVKLMLYLVEDNVTTSTPQSGSNQGNNFVHKDVLREVYSNQIGDVIPAGSISLTSNYEANFTGLTLPANVSDVSELKVIAFVRKNVNGNKFEILNVQEVEVGSNQDFD
ncbi:Omp28-related outer membrane protein [Xanthomarina sp. F1114]|uniref:Omp28-related outer membrane protein n=1 Tax=Xanthomarina sp. F1114 TaxID=2996019 RepID=UPI00225DE3D0|nr:Omp28-related outer membrane protein [Xanthomarina sp. F1114]MCX7547970.1 Omp28-related outer membrane protein [Xanthomarina sp. F1114]